ncbi:hypothetical protein V8E36_000810 [Tilletia maclaganii]
MPPAAKRERSNTPSTAAPAVKKEAGSSSNTTGAGSSTTKKESAAPTFRDFPIFSSQLAPNTRINLLRFAHHTPQDPTDPTQFIAPLKLNRKWPPRPKPIIPRPGDPVRDASGTHVTGVLPQSDPNAKPKKGKLYWPAYGEGGLEEIRKALFIPPELNISAFPPAPKRDDDDDDDNSDDSDTTNKNAAGPSSSQASAPNKKGFKFGSQRSGGGKGKKKGAERKGIREIFKATEGSRLLRKQEYMPWVLEDFETSEDWESGVQAANRYKALIAQFGEKYIKCAGNAGIVQMYLRGAVESAQGGEGGGSGGGLVGEVKEEKKRKSGYMDRNHAPWIGKLEGDVHGSLDSSSSTKSDGGNYGGTASPSSSQSTVAQQPNTPSVSSSPHVIFVFDHRHDGSFKLVPVQAAYKFTQKPAYSTTTADEANERWEKLNKIRQRGGSAYQKISLTSNHANGEESQEGQGEGARALLQARTRSHNLGPRRSGGAAQRLYVKKEKMDEEDAAELASWSTYQQRSMLALPGMNNSRPRSLLAVYGERGGGAGGSRRGYGGGGGGGGGGDDGGGALDEVEYEEDFADDEEIHQGPGAENAQEEQEQKEYADRLKEEMSRAGWEGRVSGDEGGEGSDDEEMGADADLFGDRAPGSRRKKKGKGGRGAGMGRSGRELKKVMRMAGRAEGMDAYDSEDEDANPYASEEDDESESDEEKHLALTNPDEAVRRAREARREKEEREAAAARRRAAAAERDGTPALGGDDGTGTNSTAAIGGSSSQRAGQPGAAGSGFANSAQRAAAVSTGHRSSGTYVPRRAGSPSPPPPSPSRAAMGAPSPPPSQGSSSSATQALKVTLKRKSEAISSGRAASPSSNAGGSPPASRASSPSASGPTANGTSSSSNEAKRQKTSISGGRASSPTPKTPANDIEREVIRLVRDAKVQTTQELVRHFAKHVKNPQSKEQLSAAIRRVCMIERGKNTLLLKEGW